MKGHLTVREISDWLAARKLGEAVDPEIGDHIEQCDTCRAAADRADALLDVAASAVVEDDSSPVSSCPDDLKLSAYADGTLSTADREPVWKHVVSCSVCRAVVEALYEIPASGRSRRTLWVTSIAALATAAVFSIFFVLSEPQKLDLRVAVFDVDTTRSSIEAHGEKEFEVEVEIAEPAHIHLLVVDRAGELTLLAERRVEAKAVLGRYGIQPPGQSEPSLSRRAYVLLISAEESLLDKLDEFEHDPVSLSEDSTKAAAQVEEIGKRIEEQFNCIVRSAPITVVD